MTVRRTVFGLPPERIYQIAKYAIYALILYNVCYFIFEDHLTTIHRFREGVGLLDIPDAYPQAVDSAAWFVLLLIFELETWVLEDAQNTGALKWSLNIISGICYFFIIQAGLGYFGKLMFVQDFQAIDLANACNAVGTYLSFAFELDGFETLTAANCLEAGMPPFYLHAADSIIASADTYSNMTLIAYTEVTNAFTWMAIVLVLWMDVFLQMRGMLTGRLYRFSAITKGFLYVVLIICAIIWGVDGTFMDFWDAFIWIIAFFFIEMNIIQWHEESKDAQAHL